MPDIPEEAVQAGERAWLDSEGREGKASVRAILEAAAPHMPPMTPEEFASWHAALRSCREPAEEEIRVDERRKVAEEIAKAILEDADPLIATRTGASLWEAPYRAAWIARQIGDGRDPR